MRTVARIGRHCQCASSPTPLHPLPRHHTAQPTPAAWRCCRAHQQMQSWPCPARCLHASRISAAQSHLRMQPCKSLCARAAQRPTRLRPRLTALPPHPTRSQPCNPTPRVPQASLASRACEHFGDDQAPRCGPGAAEREASARCGRAEGEHGTDKSPGSGWRRERAGSPSAGSDRPRAHARPPAAPTVLVRATDERGAACSPRSRPAARPR